MVTVTKEEGEENAAFGGENKRGEGECSYRILVIAISCQKYIILEGGISSRENIIRDMV